MDATQLALHAEMEEKHWWFLGRRDILRSIVRRLLPPGGQRLVVDVGCGTGGNVAALADEYRTVGIDTSAHAIELARERYPGVRFWDGEIAQLPSELDASADAYLLMDVLEHVSDDFLLLATLVSRCKRGARVVITVPAHQRLWSPHDEALGHFRRYDAKRLAMLWQDLPVRVVLLSYFCARLYPAVRLARWLSRRSGRSVGSHGTDLRVPPAPVNRLLARLFGGEAGRLTKVLEGRRAGGYRTGSSLLAVLEVERQMSHG
jgi:SAM-dependent methyltransferase